MISPRHRFAVGQRRLTYSGESGVSIVEFAMVLALLILLTLGIVDGGRLVWSYSMLSNAASEGVRYAAVHSGKSKYFPVASPTPHSNFVTEDEIKTQVTNMGVGLGLASTDITVSVINPAGTVLAWDSTNAKPGSTVRVAAQCTFTPITALFGTLTLSNSSEIMIAR